MALLSADSFNRANSTTSLGTTDGAGSLDPRTWVQQLGTWGISSNQAYNPTPTGIATVDLLTGDVDVSVTIATVASGSQGLIWRFSDTSNYWLYFIAIGNSSLNKDVAGSFTQIGGSLAGFANGDVARVVANGSSITIYKNGVSQATTTDSFNATATKCGFRTTDQNVRYDSWTASDLVTGTTVTGTQATETDTASSGTLSGFYSPSTLPLLTYSLDTPSAATARGYMVLE